MRFTNLTRHVEIGANCYCLEAGGKKIVLDSGMHPRASGDDATPNFKALGDDTVDAIVLTHAHQDHVGTLPLLMRRQPRARAYMSEATKQLSEVMLHNSVNVMLKQRDELGQHPLFSHREVDNAVRRWQGCPLHRPFSTEGERIGAAEEGPSFELFNAGHVLGATGVLIRAEGRKIFYTGDVNFEHQNISSAAGFPEEPLDVLIVETTRGDHETPPGFTRAGESLRLAKAIGAAFQRGGCVLMPLFALGKTQELLTMFYEFRAKGLLVPGPVYIGGLSTKLTEIYDKLARSSARLKHDLQILDAVAPFVIAGRQTEDPPIKEGRIYALSSGMMTEKTISNHFARRILSDPKQTLIFVGYADPVSPAGRIMQAKRGDRVSLDPALPSQELLCTVERFNFSGHASRESIRAYVNRVAPKKIILIHGDSPAIEWFRSSLARDLPGSEILVPTPGVPVEI